MRYGMLFRVLDLAARHAALGGWLTGMAVGAVVMLGVVAGARTGSAATDVSQATVRGPLVPAALPSGQAGVQGAVLVVRPAFFLVRAIDGSNVVIRVDERTRLRRAGSITQFNALAPGHRVLVLGRVQDNGQMRARVVVIRGAGPRPPGPAITPDLGAVQ